MDTELCLGKPLPGVHSIENLQYLCEPNPWKREKEILRKSLQVVSNYPCVEEEDLFSKRLPTDLLPPCICENLRQGGAMINWGPLVTCDGS
jgi:hypothetical protein